MFVKNLVIADKCMNSLLVFPSWRHLDCFSTTETKIEQKSSECSPFNSTLASLFSVTSCRPANRFSDRNEKLLIALQCILKTLEFSKCTPFLDNVFLVRPLCLFLALPDFLLWLLRTTFKSCVDSNLLTNSTMHIIKSWLAYKCSGV